MNLLCRDGNHPWVKIGAARVCPSCGLGEVPQCHHAPTNAIRCSLPRGHEGEHVCLKADNAVYARWDS